MTDVVSPEYLRKVKRNITQYGWAVQGIVADPPWAYTVGLTQRGLPELLVKGRSLATTWAPQPDPHSALSVATHILNGLARRARDEGLEIGVDYLVEPPLDLMRFRVEPMSHDEARATLKVARVMYGTRLKVLHVEQVPGQEHVEYALRCLGKALRHIRTGQPDLAVEELIADFCGRSQTSAILRHGDAADLTRMAHAGPAAFTRHMTDLMRERKL